jgi:CheY-like chemotaxis protein
MRKHIMLIDEDKENLRLFMTAIEGSELDCKCTYATDCKHASQMLEYLSPDSIFVQLEPDVTEGLEFVRNIKKTKRLRGIPVVVYSAHMPYYNFLARGHGADHCMFKPNDPDEIRRTVEAMFLIEPRKPEE